MEKSLGRFRCQDAGPVGMRLIDEGVQSNREAILETEPHAGCKCTGAAEHVEDEESLTMHERFERSLYPDADPGSSKQGKPVEDDLTDTQRFVKAARDRRSTTPRATRASTTRDAQTLTPTERFVAASKARRERR